MRALASRNYRLFFTAQGISLTGMWMQRVAIGWLVYELTESTRALGIVELALSLPSLFLAPLAGALIARWDLRVALAASQVVLMIGSFLLGVLTLGGWINYPWIVVLAFFIGSANAFDMPIRQSLVVYMVDDKEDVPNAVALNSSLFNVARLIGPSIAGFAIHRVGEAICFFFNALSYSATLFALSAMRMEQSPVAVVSEKRETFFRGVLKTMALLRSFPPFKYVLLLLAGCSVFGFPYLALMPAMARTVLGGTSKTMGILLSAVGIGALVGSLIMAARKSVRGLDRIAAHCSVAFGVLVMVFSMAPNWKIALLVLPPLGFCMVTNLIACNTFLQALVRDRERSRLMGLYIVAIIGVAPIGSFLIGTLADSIGTRYALSLSGSLCALLSLYFVRKLKVHAALIEETCIKRNLA